MSNEKLGAEQGREFDFEAIGDAIDRVLAGQRELTPAEQKNLRGIYSKLFTKLKPEQAYHARGAAQLRHWTCRECSYQFAGGGNGVTYCPSCCKATLTEYVPSEPGADTGTTVAEELSGMLAERMIKLAIKIQGPYATFGPPESLERRKKSHQERIEELTGMLTTEFAECLERGTTPPDEGLALERAANWFEERGGKWDAEFIATQLRALATTQRAPVEQGRAMCECLTFWATHHPECPTLAAPAPNEVKREYIGKDGRSHWRVTGGNCGCGWTVINDFEWQQHLKREVAAPDHAREGALLREAKWWYKEFVWPWRADDEDSDDRARKRLAALADGKEGGE